MVLKFNLSHISAYIDKPSKNSPYRGLYGPNSISGANPERAKKPLLSGLPLFCTLRSHAQGYMVKLVFKSWCNSMIHQKWCNEKERKKKRMKETRITRTIESTNVETKVYIRETDEIEIVTLTVPKKYKTMDALLKAVKEIHETEDFVILGIETFEEVQKRYAMSESDFIKYAVEIEPRKVKEKEEQE